MNDFKENFNKDAIEKYLEGSDAFSEKVLNRLEGEERLGTKCGGVTTILIKLWLIAMTVWYIITIMNHDFQTIS